MDYETILYETKNKVATITLNRPERLNAWTSLMSEEVHDAILKAVKDNSVRVIMITGSGKAFCAGADIEELKNMINNNLPNNIFKKSLTKQTEHNGAYKDNFIYFIDIPKPVIAVINGPAVGIGFVLALFCDIRIASNKAKFSTMFSKRGLIAEHGISWLLPKIVGLSNAVELLFTGRLIDAEEALKIGLINKLVSEDFLKSEAESFADYLCTKVSPRSIKVMKAQIFKAQQQSLVEAIETAYKEMQLSFNSEDFKEGILHFIEKREPKFIGR